jgi:hypothetical protein
MKLHRSTLFITCVLIVNILAMLHVDQQGIPAFFASSIGPLGICLLWLAVNLLCFFIYTKLRPK